MRERSAVIHGVDLVVAVIILAVCAWLYYLTAGFEHVADLFAQDVPPEFFPRLLIWVIVLLTLVLPFEHLLNQRVRGGLDKRRSQAIKPMAFTTVALLLAAVLLMPVFGTYVCLALVCLLLPLLWGERRWRLLIPYVLVFPALVMVLFSRVLGIYFEPGLFGLSFR